MKVNIPEESKSNIRDFLEDRECCKRCILKYLFYFLDDLDVYTNPEDQPIFKKDNDTSEFQINKKVKKNPCRVCLDILSEETMETCLTFPSNFEEYKIPSLRTLVQLPNSLKLREHSMLVDLRNQFPNIYKDVHISDFEDPRKIFKIVSSKQISQKINKTYQFDANFQVNINIKYEDNDKEMEQCMKQHKKIISKNKLLSLLDSYEDHKFKNVFPVPPEIPNKVVTAEITYLTDPVYLGGRYLKFSREMGQTPFIVNNVAVTESSVQDKIFRGICEILGCREEDMVFSSSGREDCDTRMLGDGRPFYIQIKQPKFNAVSYQQCRTIENVISQSEAVVVIRLQKVTNIQIKLIKEGEQHKTKSYLALCKTLSPDILNTLNLINLLDTPLVIQQKTPIRVLHRRTQLVRERTIYNLEATPVEGRPDLFCLKLETEAGTYVKEFVHGDFNRTCPNLTRYTGYTTDVVALDVTKVNLEWP